jgi:hypothetical protein
MTGLKNIATGTKPPQGSWANPAPGQGEAASLKDKAVTLGMGALVAGAGFLVVRKLVKSARKNRKQKLFSEEGQQALLIHSAINPSGISWLKWTDGTNEEAIFEVARQITKFKKVAQEYKILYNRALVSELEKELSTEEYAKFMDIVNSGEGQLNTETNPANLPVTKSGSNSGNKLSGKIILTKEKTKFFEKLAWYPIGSSKTVAEKSYVPFLTSGNTRSVSLALNFYVHFIEVTIKTKEGTTKTLYAKMDDLELVSPASLQNYINIGYTKVVFSDEDF